MIQMIAQVEKIHSAENIAPVVLLVFNRPKLLARVLDALRVVRPPTVLVVADGPRTNVAEDVARCAAVRDLIERGIDWEAKVIVNQAETNLGLRQRVSSGLTWVFEQVERAIILEDDCVPHPGFFRYCTELLEFYRNDPRIGAITGNNFQRQPFDCGASYYFSRYPHCWGWATWRRAWKFYDDEMRDWPFLRDAGWLHQRFPNLASVMTWELNFDRAYHRQKLQSWDYPWTFSCWKHDMLAVNPRVNLVTNIGFGEMGTNMRDANSHLANRPVGEMTFPLTHPDGVRLNARADYHYQRHYLRRPKWRKLARRWWLERWRR